MTGTSVLGVKYDGGVMLAADTLGAYCFHFRRLLRHKTRLRGCLVHSMIDTDEATIQLVCLIIYTHTQTTASYGSLARFDDVQRLHKVGDLTCVGASGDLSDYQQLQHMLDSLSVKQSQLGDDHALRTSQIFEYLTRVMYNRRSKMNPLWNSLLVAGWEQNKFAEGEQGAPYVQLKRQRPQA